MKKKSLFVVIIVSIISTIFYSYLKNEDTQAASHNLKDYLETEAYKIIDGDTIEIKNHSRVRYIGIDTPEIGQAFYEEAKDRNRKLVEGKKIKLVICKSEPRDKYGRILAWVYTGGSLVNAVLVKEGYARVFIISPCGIEKKEEFERYEREAIKGKIGIWSVDKKFAKDSKVISAIDASKYIGKVISVKGRVVGIFNTDKATFLNFGNDYKKDFTVVIFRKDKVKFNRNGITSFDLYKNKEIVVTGKIQEYNGPEIIVDNPSQIEVIKRR
ncbi:MAG: thermonuclease family protein [Deltaproteobacteria bacterium]|nr:thermonuclease family protein [Deltaproteobacteria bacterium]